MEAFITLLNQALVSVTSAVSVYSPRLLVAIITALVGYLIARLVRSFVISLLEKTRVSLAGSKTPLEHLFENETLGHRIEALVGSVCYWLILLLTAHAVVSLFHIPSLTAVFSTLLVFVSRVSSAVFVFIVGVLLAGLVETVVKKAVQSLNHSNGRVIAKISSYGVTALALLAAIAELGIASQFILILFAGLVFSFSLALGLALGLGSKNLAQQVIESWFSTQLQQPPAKTKKS